MDSPISFPSQFETAYKDAQAFRRLTPSERLAAILDLIGSGSALMAASPHREAALRLHQQYEDQWQKTCKELFKRHGQ